MARESKYFQSLSNEDRNRFATELSQPSTQEEGRRLSLTEYNRAMSEFIQLIDDSNSRLGRTTDSLVVGRFYHITYLPRNRNDMKRKGVQVWDRNPIILCTSKRQVMSFGNNAGSTMGFRGINFHYIPIRSRRAIMKKYILNNAVNKRKFQANRPLDIFHFDRDPVVLRENANRQYLFAGMYSDPATGEKIPAGASAIRQVPYSVLPELLTLPSAYQANWINTQ